MNEFTVNGNTLNVRITGRLDTLTAPVLEKELADRLDGINSLVVDCSAMDYISSGGLRVLLALCKKLDSVRVENANDTVREIFEVTGFDQIVTMG